MKIRCVEVHTVLKNVVYDIPESELIDEFGSIDVCKEAIEEDSEQWQEYVSEKMCDIDYEVKEDWVSERKGGYEVKWHIDE